MTVGDYFIRCDRYGCPTVEKLDAPIESVCGSADWTIEVRRWFGAWGWRTADAGDGRRRADLCPQHSLPRESPGQAR